MNRNKFLERFFELFNKHFDDNNKQLWWDAYKKVLPESIDFDRLEDTLLNEWDKRTAPTPAWLKQRAVYTQGLEPPEALPIANIWGTAPNGFNYCFGYNTEESNYGLEAEKLLKMGFKNIRKEEKCNKVLT